MNQTAADPNHQMVAMLPTFSGYSGRIRVSYLLRLGGSAGDTNDALVDGSSSIRIPATGTFIHSFIHPFIIVALHRRKRKRVSERIPMKVANLRERVRNQSATQIEGDTWGETEGMHPYCPYCPY